MNYDLNQYLTTDIPAFGKLIDAIRELTAAGLLKWSNPAESDFATLRLTIRDQFHSPQYNCAAVGIQMDRPKVAMGRPTLVVDVDHLLVAGIEAANLNTVTNELPREEWTGVTK